MFGDERASAKEKNLFWCGFRDRAQRFPRQRNWRCTCVCALCSHLISDFCKPHHYWVPSQTSNFSTIGQSVLEIRSARVDVDSRCARANVQGYRTNDLYQTHSYWVPNHSLHSSTVRPVVPEIWNRCAHQGWRNDSRDGGTRP